MGGGGAVKNVEKNDRPLIWVHNCESSCFFDFEPKKCFRVPTPWDLYGAEWDERSCNLCSGSSFLLCPQFWGLREPVVPSMKV